MNNESFLKHPVVMVILTGFSTFCQAEYVQAPPELNQETIGYKALYLPVEYAIRLKNSYKL